MLDTPNVLGEPNGGALVLFSAGQDSTTCLAWALSRYERVETIGFNYGQRHRIELDQRPVVRSALTDIFPDWGAKLGADHVVDITSFGALADSALTTDAPIAAPSGALPTTFVPGRNLVFLTYAAALGYTRGLSTLVGGMCETDFAGYPDCRSDTITAMAEALRLGLNRPVDVQTPLMFLTKSETWRLAADLGGEALIGLIQRETHTCYRGERDRLWDWGYGCGHCPACELRARGWEEFTTSR